MERDAWLELRRSGLGGSDAAAALGESPWLTAYELYLEKTGAVPPREESVRMRMGRRLEAVIANEYAHVYGVRLRRRHQVIRHPEHDWMFASPDRLIEGQRAGLEAKAVDPMAYRFGTWGEENSDEIPAHYLFQCVHYLACTGYERWYLAALVGGYTLRRYVVERDSELIELLIEREHEFWRRVERREPPELDYSHPTTIPLLKRLHPDIDGSEIALPEIAWHLHEARMHFESKVDNCQRAADAAKAELLEMTGKAAIGRLQTGDWYTRMKVSRSGYEVAPSSHIEFRFHKSRGGHHE